VNDRDLDTPVDRREFSRRLEWVELVWTPYPLRHRGAHSLGDLTDVHDHQRSFVVAELVEFTVSATVNSR
jgi:hypothetical protein